MFENKKHPHEGRPDVRTIAILGLECAGLLVAAVLVGFIVGGCGEQSGQVASNGPQVERTAETSAVVAMNPGPSGATSVEGADVPSPDSLPPEVVASVTDTLIIPGAAVEITAQTSVDARDVLLSDGRGSPQPFVYDGAGKVWRAYYRVPLKSDDRLGLSVTAKNTGGRWRRVWVFLNVDRGTGSVSRETTPVQP